MDKILKNILDIKSQKGITDRKFVTDIGISLTSVSEWKSEKSKTYLKYLPIIAEYLEVPVEAFTGSLGKLQSTIQFQKIEIDDKFNINTIPQTRYIFDQSIMRAAKSETTFDEEELNLLHMFRKFNSAGKKKILTYLNDIYPNKKLKDE